MDEKILDLLRRNQDYISGEDLAQELDITRSAVHKHVEKLRTEGYDILAVPHLGYKLVKIPDKLTGEEISWKLGTKIIGNKIYSYQKTASTMDIAHKLAQSHTAEGTCIFAEEQTKGRGRMQRHWISPKGDGIYFSVVLYPDMPAQEAPKITLMTAVSVALAIRKITPLMPLIKWPNDILINGKKVCGILTEMEAEPDAMRYVVLGIGVNANTKKEDLPKTASSLKEQLGSSVSRIELAKELLRELDENYALFKKEGFRKIIKLWREYSSTLGLRLRVMSHGRKVEGHAMDVDESGALLVRLDSGFIERVLAGDVVILR
ncbi:MAG: biotin--[acetyl-CoA-carboxylase] ligase [Candidatus Omnitrophota bacterium]